MPNKEEVKYAGACIVDTVALNAILEHLNTTQVGKVLFSNLKSKQMLNLHVDEVEYLNSYLNEKKKKLNEDSKHEKAKPHKDVD